MRLYIRHPRLILCSLAILTIGFSSVYSLAARPIEGFRDLQFGMTEEQVSALPACRSATECLYELTDKNRYVELTYLPDAPSGNGESQQSSVPRLARITIDMGQYTEEWYQQLQMILGSSYTLTHDMTDATLRAFLDQQQPELNAGYENGQVLLRVVRRPFGNMTLKVVYQNPDLAKDFTQDRQAQTTSRQ